MVDALTWMHNIGIAILTILISVAIFIIQDENRLGWDKLVILDKVIEVKNLFVSLFFIFIPVLFWKSDGKIILTKINIIIFILFLIGLIYSIKILFNSYKWIRAIESEEFPARISYRTKLRFECLRAIKDYDEKRKIWALTWNREIKDLIDELDFLNEFLQNLQKVEEKPKEFCGLLKIFSDFLEKRRITDWRVFDILFPNMLEWHYKFSDKRYKGKDENNKDFGEILETQHILNNIITDCVVKALKGKCSYLLFENLKKYAKPFLQLISEHKDAKAEKYIQNLFSGAICRIFFDNIALSEESHDIWDAFFPRDWKITAENLNNSYVARIWWKEFQRWAMLRIINPQTEYDEPVEMISRELFPDTDPILWADVLRFLFTPWINNQRMKSVLNAKFNFGFVGRLYDSAEWTADIDLSKTTVQDEIFLKNTINLALLIGGDNFSVKNLESYLKELEQYPDNPHTKSYQVLFESMLQKQKEKTF